MSFCSGFGGGCWSVCATNALGEPTWVGFLNDKSRNDHQNCKVDTCIIIKSLLYHYHLSFKLFQARGSPLTSGPSTKVVGSCSGNFKSHPLVWLVDKMAPPRDFNQKCHLAGLLGLALDGSNAARVILDQPMESISHPFAFHAGSHTQVVALREKSVHFHFTPISRSILVLLVLWTSAWQQALTIGMCSGISGL